MSAKRKLLVTGAHGFVAGSVLAQATDRWEVHALSREPEPAPGPWEAWHAVEDLSADRLASLFEEVEPDSIIHTAAVADIDVCQKQPELAWNANVELTRNLVRLCAKHRRRLIFCSTDTIFDGEHAPYKEEDAPLAVNRYAETKIAAEKVLEELGTRGVIARLSLVIGLPVLGAGNSFLARMLGWLKAGRTISVPEREIRTPVDVITVRRALLELAAGDQSGIFHLAGLTRINRLELGRRIAARLGFPELLVVPQAAEGAVGRAPRPRDVSLLHTRTAELKIPMRTLDDGLSLVLAQAA